MTDDEQAVIIERPAASRVIVLAAAGTGKTEVVVRRLAWLVGREDLLPGRDLLVLSFSRAAVGEVRRRLQRIDPKLSSARVVTIDSLASRLLATYGTDEEWLAEGYDGRIRAASELLGISGDAETELAGYRHVIVDEIQDLVGDRAEFVGAILTGISGDTGFTVLGDPAQGIFDFQLDESRSKVTARQLLRRLFDLEPAPTVVTLSHNYRAASPDADRAARYGAQIREAALSEADTPTDLRRLIEDDLYRLAKYDGATAARLLALRSSEEARTGAVLCRFNSQALVVSRALHNAGLPHRLQQAADDPPAAAWIARVLFGFQYSAMSRSQFDTALDNVDVPHADPDDTWRALKRVEGRRHAELSVRLLGTRIRTRRLGDDLVDLPRSNIVVSSVHRAKGLEWDLVFLCGLEQVVDDPFSDSRLLYVAMTRTRDELYVLDEPDTRGMKSKDQADGRWVRRSPSGQQPLEMELLRSDVHTLDPAGTYMIHEDPISLQSYLATVVGAGDEVQLVLARSSVDGQPRAVYRIDHRGRPLGVTSEAFARAVWNNVAQSGTLEHGFPHQLSGARVYAVETVGGSSAAGQRAGFGSSGLWLAPRLHGLAEIAWEVAT